MRKWIVILFLAVLLILEGCGSAMVKKNDDMSIVELTEAYLEERYGEPFTYAYPWDLGFAAGHNMLMKCESIKDDVVAVEVKKDVDGNWVVLDNFLEVKYQQPIRDLLAEYCTSEFSEIKIHYDAGRNPLPATLPADISFEDYLASGYNTIYATIEVRADEFTSREQAERIGQKLAATGASFAVSILALEDEAYGKLEMGEIRSRVSNEQFVRRARLTNSDGQLNVRWQEGKIG